LDRLEDLHNFTWGALGYNLLDSANGVGDNVLDSALRFIASKTDSRALKGAAKICTVFNPSFWARTDVVQSGRIYPIPANINDVVVRDRTGNVVPSQLVGTTRDRGGNLVVTNVEFLAKEVPSLGYDTYCLSFSPKSGRVASDLKADQQAFQIENRFLRIKLDPTTGAVSSLIDKRSGMEMLRSQTAEYPVFKGKPNPAYTLRRNIPAGCGLTTILPIWCMRLISA